MEKSIILRNDFQNKTYFEEFYEIISDIAENEIVLTMKNYIQHGKTSCYEHSFNVAYCNYVVCKRFKLDAVSAARAGMLHDFFLYDWHDKRCSHKERRNHPIEHPKKAYKNAIKYFSVNEKEKDIILKHMFPVVWGLPKYKETVVIIFTDKYCTLKETFSSRLAAIKRLLIRRKRTAELAVETIESIESTLMIEDGRQNQVI